ncbi:MAG: homocysteine methyltransferase [SAR324 cluster bacterium]|uniref:Homocysteine methyltransferase n=1 Tax=SAR324 cluster bacterium TaxID=2024889 RepID=A0A2A4T5D2_9DELT|nr:MAG: homocysteine methyltransferase [SAR324 cluster bacterium]
MQQLIEQNDFVLMEAAIVEPIRRAAEVALHPTLVNAPLIYSEKGRQALAKQYQAYIDVASAAKLPIILCAPTWRANQERVEASEFNRNINADAIQFVRKIKDNQVTNISGIKVGGMIACKNDCYKPEEALSIQEAAEFHAWQINHLSESGADYIMAATIPAVSEAIGIAKAMAATKTPYIISFVIDRTGSVLDGSTLSEAIAAVDEAVTRKPLGYMVNCSYPSFLCVEQQPSSLFKRLIGFQGNASSLDHCDLDNADQLEVNQLSEWGQEMVKLNQSFGIKILGGCCGTGKEHLKLLVDHIKGT